MTVRRAEVKNLLLRKFSDEDFALIADHLEPVALPVRMTLLHENRPITHAYFPDTGICSIVALTPEREMIEAGLFGFEGTSDMVLEPETDQAPMRSFMQVGGDGWRIEATAYANAVKNSATFLRIILRYQQVMTAQMAYTALAHGSYTIPERLARWVLMAQDRVGSDIDMAHEFLATMLAVRRAGVTEAIHALEGERAIKATRGRIQVLDRGKLVDLAGGSYGVPEGEYKRVLGPMQLDEVEASCLPS